MIVIAMAGGSDAMAPMDLTRFQGVWTRIARERNDADRVAAIETATEDMPFWARGIARRVMRASMRPHERYTIRVTLTGLSIADDHDEPRPAFVDTQAEESDDARVMAQESDGALLQHWRHGNSYGTTLWTVTEARELVVSVEAYDARLRDADGEPRAIRYATSYLRDSDANTFAPPE